YANGPTRALRQAQKCPAKSAISRDNQSDPVGSTAHKPRELLFRFLLREEPQQPCDIFFRGTFEGIKNRLRTQAADRPRSRRRPPGAQCRYMKSLSGEPHRRDTRCEDRPESASRGDRESGQGRARGTPPIPSPEREHALPPRSCRRPRRM